MQSIKKCQSPCATFSGTYGHQTLPANTSSPQPAKGKENYCFSPDCNLTDNILLTCDLIKVIIDEQTLDVLVTYTTSALKVCSTWTHSDILRALSAIVYYKGPQCQQVDIVEYLFTFTPVCDSYCMSMYVHL